MRTVECISLKGEAVKYNSVCVITTKTVFTVSLVVQLDRDTPITVATDTEEVPSTAVKCSPEQLQQLRRALDSHLHSGMSYVLDLRQIDLE